MHTQWSPAFRKKFSITFSLKNLYEKIKTNSGYRLKLYSVLEKLQDRVLYFDTDSVIFTHKEGEYMPSMGDYLGMYIGFLWRLP